MKFLDTLLYMLNEMSPYILLGFLIAGLLHTFVKPSLMMRHLSGTGWRPVVKAALLGVPLPLCSCGVLPTAVSLRRNGASRAASASFLIATPQTGIDSIAATAAMLGPAFAAVRPVAALATAVAGGCLVGKAEKAEDQSQGKRHTQLDADLPANATFWQKLKAGIRYGFYDLVQSIGGWLVAGLLIAAVITLVVPDGFFLRFGNYTIVTMLAVVAVAVPMYVCATGSIPIAMSLMLKGLSPGTALVMLMAGPAANLASITIIAKSMGKRCAAIYLASIVAGSIAFGLLIDLALPASWFVLPSARATAMHGAGGFPWLATCCSALLVVLLAVSRIGAKGHSHHHHSNLTEEEMDNQETRHIASYTVKGMNCPHCRATVEKGLQALEGVTAASVDLATGRALVEGDVTAEQVTDCVRALGFDIA